MKHVLTPTPLPPRPLFRPEWLEAAASDEPNLPKREKLPEPEGGYESYHQAAYGTAEFYEERKRHRSMHGSVVFISVYCCPEHATNHVAVYRHLQLLWPTDDWQERMTTAHGLAGWRGTPDTLANLAVNVTR